MFDLFHNGELIVTIMSVVGIDVNVRLVGALVEEIEVQVNTVRFLIGNATHKPIVGIAVFSRYDVVFTNFAGKRESSFEIGGDLLDKFEFFRETIFVDEGSVGSHLHTRVDSDEVGKLTGKGGGHAFDAVFEVEDTASVIHAAGKQSGIW